MPVQSSIPPELFGDAVMVLEFLNNFGPLFDIKEVIRGGITFGECEILAFRLFGFIVATCESNVLGSWA